MEPVYDDGTHIEVYCQSEPPGQDVCDSDSPLGDLTEDEKAAGEFLGLVIDPDDDNDNGSQWGTVDNPTMTGSDFSALEGWTSEGPPS